METPKEAAKRLVDKMYNCPYVQETEAKRCALIAVEGIIDTINKTVDYLKRKEQLEYWQEVKTEIEKL